MKVLAIILSVCLALTTASFGGYGLYGGNGFSLGKGLGLGAGLNLGYNRFAGVGKFGNAGFYGAYGFGNKLGGGRVGNIFGLYGNRLFGRCIFILWYNNKFIA